MNVMIRRWMMPRKKAISLAELGRQVGTAESDLAFLQALLGRVGELIEDPEETYSAAQLANTATKVLGMVRELEEGRESQATTDLIGKLRVV